MQPLEVMQVVQTIAIIGGLIVMVAKLGGREQMLKDATANIRELREIVTSLATTVTQLATRHEATERALDEIRRRLERLEQR